MGALTAMATDATAPCPVCAGPMTPVASWVARCRGCGFWRSSLAGGAGDDIAGIEALRRDNFRALLDRLERLAPPVDASMLEVGCGRGWFLDAAAARGYRCSAVEPVAALAAEAAARGHVVHAGFFPAALPAAARYSVIVFNDVFEHLPDPAQAVAVCHERLTAGGLLVINLPSSRGILFGVARALAALGVPQPFERLWQKGLPSPHLSYFSPATLQALVGREGFVPAAQFPLASLRIAGLWARLRSTQGVAASALMYPALAALALVAAFLPQDIHVGVFRQPRA